MQRVIYTGLLMALDSAESLRDRFEHARTALIEMCPGRRRPGSSYQGFVKAQKRLPRELPEQIQSLLRPVHQQIAGRHWLVVGWLAFAVDGSRIETPRSAANEKALGRAGRDKTGPQLAITTLYHLGTGLPWAWKIGPGTDAERVQLMALLATLPLRSLLIADAGFTGYGLLQSILAGGHSFLIRVGSNVTLITGLLKNGDDEPAMRRDGRIVWLWPTARRDQPPLKLRLILIRKPAGETADVYLLTNVLEETRLSDETAGSLYAMRWGIEVLYRGYKRTLDHHKLRSDAPAQALWEAHWAMLALLLIGLLSLPGLIEAGATPRNWSLASGLRMIRNALRSSRRWRRRADLRVLLATARQDNYTRRAPKKARDWPHKKNEPPPGIPKIRAATTKEEHDAARLCAAA